MGLQAAITINFEFIFRNALTADAKEGDEENKVWIRLCNLEPIFTKNSILIILQELAEKMQDLNIGKIRFHERNTMACNAHVYFYFY